MQLCSRLYCPGLGRVGPTSFVVFFGRRGGGVCGRRRGSFLFSHRFLSEAQGGKVEIVKALVASNATVDKENKYGRTALSYAVKKMGNLMSKNWPSICVRGLHFQ